MLLARPTPPCDVPYIMVRLTEDWVNVLSYNTFTTTRMVHIRIVASNADTIMSRMRMGKSQSLELNPYFITAIIPRPLSIANAIFCKSMNDEYLITPE